MTLRKINHYLSVIQLIGFTASFALMTILCINEGGMVVFYTFFAFLLFLPYLVIAYYSIFKSTSAESNIVLYVNLAISLIVIPELVLPFIYELGGLIVSILCLTVGVMVFLSKRIERKLIIINTIGSIVLLSVTVIMIMEFFLSYNY